MYIPHFKYKSAKRTSDNISVYAAEMIAIQIALQWVEEIQPTTVVICSDSYSALKSILSGKSESRQDILIEVLQSLYRICQLRIIAEFLWVPAHVGVEGNEEVDKIVKPALKHANVNIHITLSKSKIKGLIKVAVRKMWQKRWNKGNKGRHLYNIQV